MSNASVSSIWFKVAFIIGLLAAAVGSVMLLLSGLYRLVEYVADYYLTFFLFQDGFDWLNYVAQPAWSLFGLGIALVLVAIGIWTVSRDVSITGEGLRRACLLALFASLPVIVLELLSQGYASLYLPNGSHFLTPDAWSPYVISIITATVVVGVAALLGWVITSVRDGALRRSDAALLAVGYVFVGGCLYAPLSYDALLYVGPLTLGALLFPLGWWRLTSHQAKAALLTQSSFDRSMVIAGKVALWALVAGVIFMAGYLVGGYKVFTPTNSALNDLYHQYHELRISTAQQTTPSATPAK